jgi:hypothetical protein
VKDQTEGEYFESTFRCIDHGEYLVDFLKSLIPFAEIVVILIIIQSKAEGVAENR